MHAYQNAVPSKNASQYLSSWKDEPYLSVRKKNNKDDKKNKLGQAKWGRFLESDKNFPATPQAQTHLKKQK
jgi:hypothetical protein